MREIARRGVIVATCFGISYGIERWPRATMASLIVAWIIVGPPTETSDDRA